MAVTVEELLNFGGNPLETDDTGVRVGRPRECLPSGLQSSLTALGVEFCLIWPSVDGGYWLFNRYGCLLPPLMNTDRDSESTEPGENDRYKP